MTPIIQIFSSIAHIQKPDYHTENRQWLEQWADTMVSTNGYLDQNALYLPQTDASHLNLQTTALILIKDQAAFPLPAPGSNKDDKALPAWAHPNSLFSNNPSREPVKRLLRGASSLPFEIFNIKINASGVCELHLNYSNNASYIGIPERQDHLIATIKEGQPIRYRINGKSDFSLTGRRQRSFVEYDYIFQWLGEANAVVYKDISVTKQVPLAECKLIDERKILK